MKIPAKLGKLLDKLNEGVKSQPHHGQYGVQLKAAMRAIEEQRFNDLPRIYSDLVYAMDKDGLTLKRQNEIRSQLKQAAAVAERNRKK